MAFEINYVSSSIVRCEVDEFALEYKDDEGTLSFSGFEEGHACGGMLYFPTSAEWDVWLPNRRGQRNRILGHILDFARRKRYFAFMKASLTDPEFFARWPRESNYLGRRYKRSPVPSQGTGKLIRPVTQIDSSANPPAVSRVSFDRPFRTQLFKTEVETVRLCSDRTARHASRVEIQFLMPWYKEIPDTFDDLTIEDITDSDMPSEAIAPLPEKWKGLGRLISLRANDGTRGLILSSLAYYWEDDAPPGTPSKVPIPGTPSPPLY